MNIDKIKNELTFKVTQLMKSRKKMKQPSLKAVQNIKSWTEKVAETEDLIHRIHHALNELLIQHSIYFNNDYEKEGFASYMEPIINDLVIKNMED